MNSALLKRLGISESKVKVSQTTAQRGKETTDSVKVKEVRQAMNNTYLGNTSIISASYLLPNYKRDENDKILLDKDKKKVIEHYSPKTLQGQFILEDNGDGTHTATKLNVYKESYVVDSESIQETKIKS